MRLICLAIVLVVLPLAAAADTLFYYNSASKEGEKTSYTSYDGDNFSDSLWDYVYSIGAWDFETTPMWGIVCEVQPVHNWQSSNWAYHYYTSIPAIAEGWVTLYEIDGRPGVVWMADGATTDANYFHFQTELPYSPVHQPYDGNGWNDSLEYSASPEPGSMALTGLVLLGVGFLRRRQAALGKSAP